MKSIPKLIDAVAAAFSNALPHQKWEPLLVDAGWVTHCNEAVNFVCKALGYDKFDYPATPNPDDAELANQMFDAMIDPNGDWMTVAADVAQVRANEGELVLAGWKNPNGIHGHVCVVIPGEIYAGSHFGPMPKVMNVGQSVFLGKEAALAFSSMPTFFVLKAVQ